jgi:hypothetical protein
MDKTAGFVGVDYTAGSAFLWAILQNLFNAVGNTARSVAELLTTPQDMLQSY